MNRQYERTDYFGRFKYRNTAVVVFVFGVVIGAFWLLPGSDETPEVTAKAIKGEPVALSLREGIEVGYLGDVHPMLHSHKPMTVTAHWGKISNGNYVSEMLPPEMCDYLLTLSPEIPRQEYTAEDFSAFLPNEVFDVGQTWSISPERVQEFLKQFQCSASMELKAQGRRLGPNGSFAILRAKSAAYLDIAIRVHAEFDITPITWSAEMPEPDQVWYTPSYFTGRIIVNRETGSVDYFHLALPEDTTLNVHVTVSLNHRTMDSHDIVRVDRMELIGGDAEFATKELLWDEAISRSEAHRRLERIYYKFMAINWVPFADVLSVARETSRPILAMVLWGNLDDQSC